MRTLSYKRLTGRYYTKTPPINEAQQVRRQENLAGAHTTEYPIKNRQGRGVCFDVFARDSKGREHDIEIHRANKGAEPKRARYNSALMHANAFMSGEDVDKLHDSYVIFITENDVMDKGRRYIRLTAWTRSPGWNSVTEHTSLM